MAKTTSYEFKDQGNKCAYPLGGHKTTLTQPEPSKLATMQKLSAFTRKRKMPFIILITPTLP